MKRILIVILFFLFISEISFAEIFKWVDEKGVVHFTDDILQVPEKYRSKTKKMELPEGIEETKGEGESTPKTKERDQVKNEIDQYKIKIEEATNMINKKVPDEAELYKAKPEWLR